MGGDVGGALVGGGGGAGVCWSGVVLGGLWVGREHLYNVARKAFFNAPDVDDSDEVLSYRGAVLGMVLSIGVMVFWLWRSGIPPLAICVFLFIAFVIFIALTRVVVEGGDGDEEG